ncbi:MAG: tetratricopeptide repeat protein [Tepidisphaeraceae bacterium]|jgi:protein O-GlcNAc transferase
MPTERILELATEYHKAGRLGEAEGLYRQILQAEPENADALHRLGVLAMQRGDNAGAIGLIERAVAARPGAGNFHASLGQALAAAERTDDGIAAFERAIGIQGDLAEAWFGLGLALQSAGNRERAVEVYRQLVAIKPDFFEAHNNLGNALFGLGKVAEAAAAYRRALGIRPDSAEAVGNLGSALNALGRTDEAIEMFRRGLKLSPDSALVCNNLGNALCARKRFDEAVIVLRRAMELKPDFAQAAYNLGNALVGRGEYAQAVECFRKAVALDPKYVDAHNNLGNALQAVRKYKEAAEAYLAALKIQPDFYVGYNNLGNALRTMSKTDDAITAFQQAIRLRPDYHPAHCNLGNAMKDAGRLDEAIACYRRAMELQPRDSISHSNLCLTMLYHPNCDPAAILREALRWNVLHAQPVKSEIRPHDNDRSSDRRLRIGYVGADFREHCQSLFTIPLFSNHDRAKFEIFCYAHVSRPDATTERIRGLVDEWRSILGLSDQAAARKIRADRIDVLVDLTMHMSHGRPLVFARKPAPVQAAWLAYPGTTGLAAMDYRLTDPFLDPPGVDHFYGEKSIRLPETFWCYDPLCEDLQPGPLPASTKGYTTFGCLNNFCKVTEPTLHLWARILSAAVNSRLILLAAHGGHRTRVQEYFRDRGIDPDRIEFVEFQPRRQYLEVHHRIDVGLDTIPYNGHTTSLDSFWMGVPVVTRIGQTVVGRAGWSQLCNLELKELAAESDEQFVKIALELAADLPRLTELRRGLRARMNHSPLMDAPRFARNMEAAYWEMWKGYCKSSGQCQ